MKILMATMQLDIGGAETHIVELSKALARKGVEVMVASSGGAYVKELEDSGIRHFNVPLGSKNPRKLIAAYKALENIILSEKIDVVHAHARIPGFVCGLLQKKHKFRFVTTAHWVFSTKFPLKLLTNWGDRSLAVSDDIKEYLIHNYGIDGENIRITINGIDTEKFSDSIDYSDIAREFSFGEERTRICYVSRMDIDRSLAAHKLIEAVPTLYSKIPDLEVVIVGGGNDFLEVKAEADKINKQLGSRVIITTGARIDINKFAASCDAFVGVSRAALEAMACKKPSIIAGNEGYIGIFDRDKLEVAIDTNFCCRGCEETTTDKLCRDLIYLLSPENADYRKALGEFSLETVKKYYSVDTMANDAMKMYVSIIKGSKINSVSDLEFDDIEKFLLCGTGKRSVDVAISGYYGFHNSGDDSILKVIIDDLKSACPNAKITVLSHRPGETSRDFGVNSLDRLDFFSIWKLFKRTKLLISGGGSLVQDVTSSKSLFYYLLIIKLAKLRGAKVMVYANGIGPITKPANLKYVENTLKKVDYITLREESSLNELKRILDDFKHCEVTADPAFNALPECADKVRDAIILGGISSDKKYFVLSMRDWDDLDKSATEKLALFCDKVYNEYGIMPFIIPMQKKFDQSISAKIDKAVTIPHGALPHGCPPEIMMGIIANAEFTVGMRLHTLIYSVKMGVPCIALDYDPKVTAVMHSANLKYLQKVDRIDPDELFSFVTDILKNKAEITERIKEKSNDFCTLAKRNTDIAVKLLEES